MEPRKMNQLRSGLRQCTSQGIQSVSFVLFLLVAVAQVHGNIKFTKVEGDSVKLGENATLTCNYTLDGDDTTVIAAVLYTWHNNITEIPRVSSVHGLNPNGTCSVFVDEKLNIAYFTFTNVSFSDGGCYVIKITTNKFDFDHGYACLTLIDKESGVLSTTERQGELTTLADEDSDKQGLTTAEIIVTVVIVAAAVAILLILAYVGWKRKLCCGETEGYQNPGHEHNQDQTTAL